MKHLCRMILAAFLILSTVDAAAAGFPDTEKYPKCPFCNMDREKYAFSRVLVAYDDGTEHGYCSLHCAAVSMAVNIDKAPLRIQVGDYDTRELIDAEAAVWVIGGDRPGVMTRRAKWAFGKQQAAEAFIRKHGGTAADFDAAMKAVYEDMYEDTRMIREKRKAVRAGKPHDAALPPKPSGEEKCPVCGMFVAKYPDWTAVVTFADGQRHYFDGAKDMFKYLFGLEKYNPGQQVQNIRHIHVTDYYDMKFIDAKNAFFVVGSDVYGPMGRELIPLAGRPDAETFMKDHRGLRILTFDDITPETIRGLD